MGDPQINMAARAAARRLAATHGTTLEAQVEAALYARASGQQPTQFIDPTALGSLIVSVAALAWTVYTDQRDKPSKPTRQSITEEVHEHMRAAEPRPSSQRYALEIADLDAAIKAIVDEIFEDAED